MELQKDLLRMAQKLPRGAVTVVGLLEIFIGLHPLTVLTAFGSNRNDHTLSSDAFEVTMKC